MINVDAETLLPFQTAGRSIPGNPHVATLHRWRLHGVRGAKLETILVGGTRFTSKEAIGRFIATQNADQSTPAAVTPKQRAKQSAAARKELAEMGV